VKSIQKPIQKEIANRGSLIVPFNNEALLSILFVADINIHIGLKSDFQFKNT